MSDERELYEFTWPGKRAAIREAGRPTEKVLRPAIEDSVNFATTENIYIEGDNLDALKILLRGYMRRVKMIYIDPPYNTGGDFVYCDDFAIAEGESRVQLGFEDDDGRNYSLGAYRELRRSNPQFHSHWCSMIYPRLRVAQMLLRDDGVMFVSIDDNEVANLRKICDELFGENNFVACLVWERAYAPKNDAKYVSASHDYILMYAKSIDAFKIGRLPRTEEANARYSNPDNDPRGVWKPGDMSVKTYTAAYDYPITTPSGRIVNPPSGRSWRFSREALQKSIDDNRIWFGADGASVPSVKRFLSELKHEGISPVSILHYKDVGHSQEGAKDFAKVMGGGYFDGPKPVRLIQRLMTLANLDTDSIILDFFAGSSTTAHAVMSLNAQDSGHRKFIMIQIPEPCTPKSEALKAGYHTISQIGRERIVRSGKWLVDRMKKTGKENANNDSEKLPGFDGVAKGHESRQIGIFPSDSLDSSPFPLSTNPCSIDIGFRAFRADSSNFRDVFKFPDDLTQITLADMADNIKHDRSDLDLLFMCVTDYGLPLSLPYRAESFGGFNVHIYGDYEIVACFGENLTEDAVKHIALMKPKRAIFRDSCFGTVSSRINMEQIFTAYSPESVFAVL